jgi:hypothetical protein
MSAAYTPANWLMAADTFSIATFESHDRYRPMRRRIFGPTEPTQPTGECLDD